LRRAYADLTSLIFPELIKGATFVSCKVLAFPDKVFDVNINAREFEPNVLSEYEDKRFEDSLTFIYK
jgi:hypothetical protein